MYRVGDRILYYGFGNTPLIYTVEVEEVHPTCLRVRHKDPRFAHIVFNFDLISLNLKLGDGTAEILNPDREPDWEI